MTSPDRDRTGGGSATAKVHGENIGELGMPPIGAGPIGGPPIGPPSGATSSGSPYAEAGQFGGAPNDGASGGAAICGTRAVRMARSDGDPLIGGEPAGGPSRRRTVPRTIRPRARAPACAGGVR